MHGRLVLVLMASLAASACGGVQYGSPRWGYEQGPTAQVDGIAYGSTYGSQLTFSDIGYMSDAFIGAMAADVGTSRVWANGRTGARGEVIAGEAFLENVDYARGRRLRAPVGLETRWMLEPAQGDYTTTTNTNVRLGASTSSLLAGTLPEGSVVEAIGAAQDAPWMLVARNGEVIGYMHTDFLEQREGGDLLLAGGAPRQPMYCRSYEQSLSLRNGPSDRWRGDACQTSFGTWQVQGSSGGPGV